MRPLTFEYLFWVLPHEARRRLYRLAKPEWAGNLAKMRSQSVSGVTFSSALRSRCVFVHVPKAAGTSLCNAIYGNPGGRHSDVRMYQLAMTKKEWSSAYKFAFVRNPWDRCYSAFRYLTQGELNQRDKKWVKKAISQYSNFDDFVSHFLNEETILSNHVLRPQHRYICTRGNIISVDFVGRFERLTEDFMQVARQINLPSAQLPHLNASGPSDDYRHRYSEKSALKIGQLYKTDCRLFGYSF